LPNVYYPSSPAYLLIEFLLRRGHLVASDLALPLDLGNGVPLKNREWEKYVNEEKYYKNRVKDIIFEKKDSLMNQPNL
jgi:hypothetical protein